LRVPQLCASSEKFGGETNFETVSQQQEKAGGAFGLLEQEWKLLDKDNSGTLDLGEVRARSYIGRGGDTPEDTPAQSHPPLPPPPPLEPVPPAVAHA
jgi:hypothetical protein